MESLYLFFYLFIYLLCLHKSNSQQQALGCLLCKTYTFYSPPFNIGEDVTLGDLRD